MKEERGISVVFVEIGVEVEGIERVAVAKRWRERVGIEALREERAQFDELTLIEEESILNGNGMGMKLGEKDEG